MLKTGRGVEQSARQSNHLAAVLEVTAAEFMLDPVAVRERGREPGGDLGHI